MSADRVRNELSLHAEAGPRCRAACRWRVLVCENDYDVVECHQCGRQETVRCRFDEEYS